MRFAHWIPASFVIFVACSGADAPSISFVASPARDVVPATIHLDASASTGAMPLVARWDFEGDGVFDTDFGPALAIDHVYSTAVLVGAKVEVKTAEGGSAIATAMIELVTNTAPEASLVITPATGKAPLVVTADASGSSDVDEAAANLSVRFDFDGDGTFDTEFARGKTASWTYRRPGSYTVVVEARDSRELSSTAQAKTPVVVLPSADISADSDRNGVIDELDDDGEENYSSAKGAVFLANLDDDDGDGRQDGGDGDVDGTEDVADLAPLVVHRHEGLAGADRVTVRVDETAQTHVRLFIEGEDGTISQLLAPSAAEAEIPASRVAAGDVRLFIEGANARNAFWSGTVMVTLAIEHGGETEEDSVAMRCAPILFPDNLQAPEILYVMRITDRDYGENVAFYNALHDGMPEGVKIYDVDQYQYAGDRWVQDNMQTGYQIMPIAGGGKHVMQTYLETQRPTGTDGLEYLLTGELLQQDLGYFYAGGNDTSLNYGGNLEIVPAHTAHGFDYPFGRVLVGGGNQGLLGGGSYEDHMTSPQVDLLFAQGAQAPLIEISTEWLGVGHVDEILQFVPDANSTTGRPWKIVVASPSLARSSLEALSAAGHGDEAVFPGRDVETTVDTILNDSRLMMFNSSAQARIDSIKDILKNELEVTDADFREVPVLYENVSFGPFEYAVAYNPGIQNLVTLGNKVFVPDPEGPLGNGADVWKTLTREALEPLGLEVTFVDIFYSYHVNWGEAHCGTEVQHVPFAAAWWERE